MFEGSLFRDRKFFVGFVASILCYGAFSAYQLTLPGLEYDEVFFGPAARGYTKDFHTPRLASSSELPSRFSPIAFSTFALSYGESSLPVMLMPYWGALKVYLTRPVFSVLGVSPQTIRLPAIFLGALSLLFFSFFLARWCSPSVGLIAAILLASDPSYIFYTRHDFGSAALTLLLACCPLWCLACWVETGRSSLWAAAFFFFGLGLYSRLDYATFLVAFGVTVLVCFRQVVCLRVRGKEIGLALFCFLVGCSPFLLFLWRHPSVAVSAFSLASPTQDFSAVARVKGYVLWTVLNGTALYEFFSGRSELHVGKEVTARGEVRVGSYAVERHVFPAASLVPGTLTPYLLLCFVAALCFFHPPPSCKALMLFLAVSLFCVASVRGALRGHHFVSFLPTVQAFLAASFVFLWWRVRTKTIRTVLVIGAMACVGANLLMGLRYHRLLAETGGRGIWSEAIYDLVQYVQEHCQGRRCLVGDWGMGTQIVTLGGSPQMVEEFFWPYIEGGDVGELDALVRTENALFIFYTDPYVNFSRPKHLFRVAAQRVNRGAETKCVFTGREGTPVIEVLELKEKKKSTPGEDGPSHILCKNAISKSAGYVKTQG